MSQLRTDLLKKLYLGRSTAPEPCRLRPLRLFICLLLFAMTLFPRNVLAEDETTVFVQGNETYKVTIKGSQLGLLLTEKALQNGAETTKVLDASGIKLPPTLNEGPLIADLASPKGRGELVKQARELAGARKDLIRAAGLVVTFPPTNASVVLTDQFIVQFKSGISRDEMQRLHAKHAVKVLLDSPYVANLQLVTVTPESDGDALAVSNSYNDSELVSYAHPDFVSRPAPRQSSFIPNDPLFWRQWHLLNSGLSGGTPDADIDADRAWAMERGNSNTLIAILDGGFDMTHPDLTPNLWHNPLEVQNGQDDDGNGYVDDINGWDFATCPIFSPSPGCGDNDPSWSVSSTWGVAHGTVNAGGAVARGNNGLGVSGSCPNCQYVPIRMGNTDFSDHLAVYYAKLVGADIMSNSWGCYFPCRLVVESAIDDVATTGRGGLGTVIFFAMEDAHVNRCTPPAPPDYSSRETVIAVSEVNNRDEILTGNGATIATPGGGFGNCMDLLGLSWGGSLWAATTDVHTHLGYNSDDVLTACGEAPDVDYTFCATGTSFATPVVAGVAGLVLSADPYLSRVQVQQLMQDTADKVQSSVAHYAETTGFSAPPSSEATHGYGRVNAYEAVRIVSSTSNGGLGGVDIFVRDNGLDWGNTEQPSNTLFDTPRGFIPHWISRDIKVDAPPYGTPPTTSAEFDALADENPLAGTLNRVYVRVHNRGPVTADTITVKLQWAYAGAGLPALPSDFWTSFPNNSADTSNWKPLSSQILRDLRYSGASVAGGLQDTAQIARFDFQAPPLDSTHPNPSHYCLLAIVDSPQDPVQNASKGSLIVDDITPNDNNLTQKNLILVEPANLRISALKFLVRNPFNRPIRSVLRLNGPEGVTADSIELPFGKPFSMGANSETLASLNLEFSNASKGSAVNIYQMMIDQADHQEKVLGGFTFVTSQQ